MPHQELFVSLISATTELDKQAKAIQGAQEILVDDTHIERLIDDYNAWYARALAVLPEELHEKFQDLYEGGAFVKRIKSFLQSPATVSALWSSEQGSGIFPYWDIPYETTFHSSLLEQRQLLTLAKQRHEEASWAGELALVEQVVRGFPAFADSLRHRYDNRPGIEILDEYDVQDLLGGVLAMLFEDVRREDPSPIHAGGSSRIDFFLKRQQILVEVKMTRPGLRDRVVSKQLIEDIELYRSHPDWSAFVGFVFDPGRHIRNPRGLETDLSGHRDGLQISVIVVSG
jgi:hypothetical protein